MELLSQSTLEALQICAAEDAIPETCFASIVNNAIFCILDPSKSKEVLSDKNTSGIDSAILKQSYPALMTLFLEAAKTDTGTEQLNLILDDCKFSQKRKDTIQKVYKESKQKIRAHLALIGNVPPHVVDVDWRLDYNLKNSQLNKVMELQYTVALKTEQQQFSGSENQNDTDVQFSCTREQLQDFVGKLKEAVKSVERMSQN